MIGATLFDGAKFWFSSDLDELEYILTGRGILVFSGVLALTGFVVDVVAGKSFGIKDEDIFGIKWFIFIF